MSETDLLFLLAELGVALAGFSAIVGVLGRRTRTSDIRVDALRLQVMLETSFIVAAAGIVPALLDNWGVPSSYLWRISGAMLLAVQIPFEILCYRRTKSMPEMGISKFNVNTINWLLSISADLLSLAVVLGLAGDHASGCYLLAVFTLLVLAALLFIHFAASTFFSFDE